MLGTDINLEMVAVGDAEYAPLEGQTALMNERARLPIIDISRDAQNPAWLRIMCVIPPSTGGWNMWEAGIYAKNGNLFAIAKLDGAYKPIYADDNYAKEVALDIILEVSSAANVNLVADPHVIIATREWTQAYVDSKISGLQALLNAHAERRDNPHQTTAAQAGAYTKAETDIKDTSIITSLNTHTANKSNPHQVSAAQAGAYTKAEADAKETAITNSLNAHTANKSNPHQVSAAQAGAYTKAEVDTKDTAISTSLSTHAANKSNPHQVTAAQAGAYTKAETDTKDTAITTSLNTHTSNVSNPHKVTAAQIGAYLKTEVDAMFAAVEKMSWNLVTSVWPKAIPLPWTGTLAAIPAGWQVCDGTNGTKDLRDRFIVGAGNKYGVNSTGGAETHVHTGTVTVTPATLSTSQMPSHDHSFTATISTRGIGDITSGSAQVGATPQTSSTGNTGDGQAHTHTASTTVAAASSLPTYYALFFIQRIS